MINDWATTEPPDIASFVPYEWEFNINFYNFEIILLVSEHNWIDCTNEDENSKLIWNERILFLVRSCFILSLAVNLIAEVTWDGCLMIIKPS